MPRLVYGVVRAAGCLVRGTEASSRPVIEGRSRFPITLERTVLSTGLCNAVVTGGAGCIGSPIRDVAS